MESVATCMIYMCVCVCMFVHVCLCVCIIQAKYDCARTHSALKVVSPDWILDSIEANKKLEEEVYHPSHLKPKETDVHQTSTRTCNGAESAEEGVTVPLQTLFSQAKPNNIATTPLQGEGVAIETTYLPVIEAAVPHQQSADSAAKKGEGTSREEATPTGVRSEQLLDGVVIYFTDYQDCVEEHTMEKWKLVSEGACIGW